MSKSGISIRCFRQLIMLLVILFAGGQSLVAQGAIAGKITDEYGEPMIGATVFVIGTYKGAISDENGKFTIADVKQGDYSVRITYVGFQEKVFNGVSVKTGQTTPLNVKMNSSETVMETVEIIGDPNIIDLESGNSGITIGNEEIAEMNVRDVQDVVSMQVGVTETPDGLVIRGGRVYETKYMIEGVSAGDPLAGTGFGVDIGSNAIGEIDVITGGGGAEFGDGTSGIINTKIRDGGDRYSASGSYYRDNLGFAKNQGMSWNTDQAELSVNGPIPFTKHRLSFFASGSVAFNDEYINIFANQLHSSLFSKNDSIWAPRQDNKWSHTVKLTYNVKPGIKISVSNQHSLNINQNTRSLQVIGNDAVMQPGFQYEHSLDMDRAATFTHQSNLTILNYKMLFKDTWTFDATLGRLFTNLRADANGRPFREQTVDQILDPNSIVTSPVGVWNPDSTVVFVFPGPGLYNNDGITTRWHDHYAQEYTLRYKFTKQTKNKVHFISFGQEHKEQEYQWIDVSAPWVGAPIVINDSTTTPSTSVGSRSDVWKVNPASGGFYAQDEIRYKGIIAFIGVRFEYWAPGKFADRAVANPTAPVTEQIRADYKKQTVPIFGRRWKARILPKIRVSFPITANNVLYFNYGHSTRLPHPRFLYAGLDPVYQDRSFLSNLGNPNLNPEVTVSYELGIKSQITKDLALTFTAFYNDKFDYIVSRRIVVKDQTGRFVEKTFYINQDYARVRGIELGVTQRIGKWLRANLNGSYQIATGKSNSASESALQIKQTGNVTTSKENYLAWDRPFDLKTSVIFKPDSSVKIFGWSLEGFRVFMSATLKSGLRYTPYILTDTSDYGRPLYDRDDNHPYSKLGAPWFWMDLKISRDFNIKNRAFLTLSVEFQNIFGNRNSQIINGVTGKAYREGDPTPREWRDPAFPTPFDSGLPPDNPSRYLQPRHIMFGASFRFQ